MASDFLKNLQKTVETGEFNSETAKRITELNELADIAKTQPIPQEIWDGANEKVRAQAVTEQEAAALNGVYEEKWLI